MEPDDDEEEDDEEEDDDGVSDSEEKDEHREWEKSGGSGERDSEQQELSERSETLSPPELAPRPPPAPPRHRLGDSCTCFSIAPAKTDKNYIQIIYYKFTERTINYQNFHLNLIQKHMQNTNLKYCKCDHFFQVANSRNLRFIHPISILRSLTRTGNSINYTTYCVKVPHYYILLLFR